MQWVVPSAESNPFRQPLPRKKDVLFKERLWNATPEGKDASTGDLKAVANHEYLWLGRSISIPLAWIREVTPTGPGLTIVWSNEIESELEGASFCIRSFFGYNKKKRDRFIETIADLADRASHADAPAAVQESENAPTCQVCGAQGKQYDFRRVINVLIYWAARKDRAVLCRAHARRRLHLNLLFNSLLGVWGLPGIFATPVTNVMESKQPRREGIISLAAVCGYFFLSCFPFTALVWCIVLAYKSML